MSHILPVAILFFLAVVLLIPAWLQNRARLASLRLVHDAIERGQSLDPVIVERLLAPARRPTSTNWFALICFIFGVLGLCVGTALAMGAFFFGNILDPTGQAGAGMMLGALINGTVGLALTLLGIFSLRMFAHRASDGGIAMWFVQLCLFFGASGAALGVALAFGAQFLAAQLGIVGQAVAGLMLGALVTGFSGLGLTVLGVVALRIFAGKSEA